MGLQLERVIGKNNKPLGKKDRYHHDGKHRPNLDYVSDRIIARSVDLMLWVLEDSCVMVMETALRRRRKNFLHLRAYREHSRKYAVREDELSLSLNYARSSREG